MFIESDGLENIAIYSTNRTKVGIVEVISDTMVNSFESIINFAQSAGFLGVESILIGARRAGKYKSAWLGRSKSEEGNARITAEVH